MLIYFENAPRFIQFFLVCLLLSRFYFSPPNKNLYSFTRDYRVVCGIFLIRIAENNHSLLQCKQFLFVNFPVFRLPLLQHCFSMPPPDIHCKQVEVLYSDHHRWLRGWLCKKLGCSEQAADLMHDTFLRILNSREVLMELTEPRAYLTTTAKRLLIDRARHRQVEQSYLDELALMTATMEGAPSPEAILIALEALKQLSDALQNLPINVSEAFLQHYLLDETQPAIAARLGVSVRMVQKYLAQALLCCHRALTD